MTTDRQILTRQAVQAALSNRWSDVVDFNLILLEEDNHDLPSLNRLAKGYEETGQIKMAKKTYETVLKIDKYNRIALNNLDRLKPLTEDVVPISNKPSLTSNFDFIEEAGKTKTVFLSKIAPHQTISRLRYSQIVKLKANNRRISVTTQDDVYLGCLPDDLSLHLIKLLKYGNQYDAAIKTITATSIEIFVRETKKSARLKGLPSFPTKETKYYYQFLPTEPIAEVPLELTDSDYSE